MNTEPVETTIDVDALQPHPRNYNKHPVKQIERLAASLVQFGQVRPIVVQGNIIIAGHGVWQAAQHLGYTSLRVTRLPETWTEEQALAYLVADNETRRGCEPDSEDLATLLDELSGGFDLAALGFSEDDYSALLDGLTPALPEVGAGGDEFEPDEDAPCRVQPGDVWLIGDVHRLICGDCTDAATVERLMQGERARTILYDPPWDITVDYTPDMATCAVLAFCDGRRAADIVTMFGPPTWVFVWDCISSWYTPNRPLQRCKLAFWYGDISAYDFDGAHYGDAGDQRIVKNPRGSYKFTPDPRGKHLSDVFSLPITKLHSEGTHPHEKPIDWIRLLLANCTNGLIFDPFLGSGTTIIAAHRTGRRCYGCEISPEYCEIILQRAEAEGLTVERDDGTR